MTLRANAPMCRILSCINKASPAADRGGAIMHLPISWCGYWHSSPPLDWRGRYTSSTFAVVFPSSTRQVSEVVKLCTWLRRRDGLTARGNVRQ